MEIVLSASFIYLVVLIISLNLLSSFPLAVLPRREQGPLGPAGPRWFPLLHGVGRYCGQKLRALVGLHCFCLLFRSLSGVTSAPRRRDSIGYSAQP